jgi:hypothetical protein
MNKREDERRRDEPPRWLQRSPEQQLFAHIGNQGDGRKLRQSRPRASERHGGNGPRIRKDLPAQEEDGPENTGDGSPDQSRRSHGAGGRARLEERADGPMPSERHDDGDDPANRRGNHCSREQPALRQRSRARGGYTRIRHSFVHGLRAARRTEAIGRSSVPRSRLQGRSYLRRRPQGSPLSLPSPSTGSIAVYLTQVSTCLLCSP